MMLFSEQFEFIVKVVIPITSAIIAIVGFGIKIIKDSYVSKKNKLDGIRSILIKRQDIEESNKFVQDLEIDATPILKGFKWLEVNSILQKDIGIRTIANLKTLSKKNLLALDGNKILLANRRYILIKHLFDLISWLLVFSFALGIIAIFYSLYRFPDKSTQNFLLLIFALFTEFLLINHFDDLISFNSIIKSTDFRGNNIYVSQSFKDHEKDYQKYLLNYYSVDRIRQLKLKDSENTNSET